MPKKTKKLIVYLDQNFISEMAKADSNRNVKPQFKQIYELLHKGFVDEKVVVPASWFHDVETSLSVELKENIVSYQNYLGQVRLNFPDNVRRAQILGYASRFLGNTNDDPLSTDIAFQENPDKRTRMLNVVVDSQLQSIDFKTSRNQTAQALENLRNKIVRSNISYLDQLKIELADQRRFCLEDIYYELIHLFTGDKDKLSKFLESDTFSKIPVIDINSKLWSSVLTHFKTRVIKSSDGTDIDIISTYLPYVDVFATDAFMADRLTTLRIAADYDIELFDARTDKLNLFINYLENYLRSALPANVPAISVFVLADSTIKEKSFDLFRLLGLSSSAKIDGKEEWVDIYGFDDGDMPKYRLKNGPNIDLPFYGLQEINVVKIKPDLSSDEVIKICREKTRSNKFLIIDKYKEITNDFLVGLMAFADSLGPKYRGYSVYEK